MAEWTAAQLTGLDDSHLVFRDKLGLTPACWQAFDALRGDALEAGFDLQVASAHRSFERQLAIFNGKARGERAVHDDCGEPVDITGLDDAATLDAILRFSALPGTSRHHWGTDLDVFDAASLPAGYRVQLTPQEVAEEGMFGPLHAWLDARIEANESHGFYRPYDEDRGGVAVERWHLSYAPESAACESLLTQEMLAEALSRCELALSETVKSGLVQILERYVRAVSHP